MIAPLPVDVLEQLGMGINDQGRYTIVLPPRPVLPLGAHSPCAIRIALQLCARALAAALDPVDACDRCRKARGWKHCAEHELAAAIKDAARGVNEDARLWMWAWALGYYHAPSRYVDESAKFAGAYARAVTDHAWGADAVP